MTYRFLFISLWLVLIGACSEQPGGTVLHAGDYTVRINTDPDPLEVGEKAQFLVSILNQDGQNIDNCRAEFRQYMPGMEMSQDSVFVELVAGNGRYQGQSSEFRMGGDWVLEFKIACAGDTQVLKMEQTLEWPE